jgi:hypothetical protein
MVPLIAFICDLESVQQRKSFPTEKLFLFQVFEMRIFKIFLNFTQCLDPNLNPNTNFFSDSDPAKIFGFFRIRTHNTGLDIKVLVPVL